MKLHQTESGLWWAEQQVTTASGLNIAPGETFHKYLSLPMSSFSLAPFPGGDVAMATVSGTVGLERKRGDDLVKSWVSGHLAEQLSIMLDSYDHVVLLVEDIPLVARTLLYYAEGTGQRLMDDLLTCQERGVRLYASVDERDTARQIEHLFQRYNRTQHHALDKLQEHKGSNVQRRQLLAVPGWGSETVKAALDSFGTPIAVVNAEPKRLERARISPRRVRYLFEAFGRTYARIFHNQRTERDV